MAKILHPRRRVLFRVVLSVLATRTAVVGPTQAVAFRQGSSLLFPFNHRNHGLSTSIAPHLQSLLANSTPLSSSFGALVKTKFCVSGTHVFDAGEEQEKEPRLDARLRWVIFLAENTPKHAYTLRCISPLPLLEVRESPNSLDAIEKETIKGCFFLGISPCLVRRFGPSRESLRRCRSIQMDTTSILNKLNVPPNSPLF